ncbi:N-acetylmuramoyl-L-alanine amidase [bacterium]|nr:MAG: N-acetylmuramoyl-L-alanine amidase [bacterium]
MNKKYLRVTFAVLFMFFYIFFPSTLISSAQTFDNGYHLKTVVIDAGHGGKDPGSLGLKSTESQVVLAIALKLGEYIEQNLKDVKVIYTRKTDEFVELYKRAEIANSNKADLFISIHANGSENHQVFGTQSLVLGTIRAGENFEVAKKENSVVLLEDDYKERYEGFDPNSPESYQSFSLVQDLYLKKSVSFAALVQDQFRERANRKDRSVWQQSLLVLARTAMPGVLIETGFITNPDEEKYLISEQGQDFLASAIFRAFRDYKELIESKSSLSASLGRPILSDTSVSNIDDASSLANTAAIPKTAPADATGEPAEAIAEVKKEVEMLAEETNISQVTFKVQIAASVKRFPLNSTLFKGEKDVKEFRVGNMYKYAIGSSNSFENIISYSKEVREKFPDAFVIAVRNNQIIPLREALGN